MAALKRIQANLKRYKASVLKAAVEGKLTEEWIKQHPDIEPASELLKRILVERRKKWEEDYVKKYVAAHGHAPKDDSWKKKYKDRKRELGAFQEVINTGQAGGSTNPDGCGTNMDIFIEVLSLPYFLK